MNRPPLLTTTTAKCSPRLEQNLTYLAPGVSGAVLLPVLSGVRNVIRPANQSNYKDDEVKNVRNSRCNSNFTFSFTLFRCITRKESQLKASAAKSDGEKITETGGSGSDPTFWASIRPKNSWSRSRPTRSSRALYLPRARIGADKS
jgi:hypothetical protein